MDLNTIEESIRRLQEKSDRAHFDTFQIASDGKSILRTDIEAYEVLLQNLTVAREFEEYRRVNEAVINRFLQLQDRVEHLDRVDVPVNEPVNKLSKKILLFKNLPPLLIKKFFIIGFIAKFTL